MRFGVGKMSGHEYRFVIGAGSPETLPMARLAQYMANLAQLFGEDEGVHFVRLEAGSTALVQTIGPEALPKVRARIHAIAQDRPPRGAAGAIVKLNDLLAEDGTTGSLRESGGAEVFHFPGRERSRSPTFGPFKQAGFLDGVLVRVGGTDDTVPVHLQDGDILHICNATRDMARRLALHLYDTALRVHGEGHWERDSESVWQMRRFDIASFETLDEAPLGAIVAQLREVPGNGWKNVVDPAAELRRLRDDGEAR